MGTNSKHNIVGGSRIPRNSLLVRKRTFAPSNSLFFYPSFCQNLVTAPLYEVRLSLCDETSYRSYRLVTARLFQCVVSETSYLCMSVRYFNVASNYPYNTTPEEVTYALTQTNHRFAMN